MEKSVRASLTMNQNTWFGLDNSGILVVAIAVPMTTSNGFRFYHTHVRTGANLLAGQYSGEVGPVRHQQLHMDFGFMTLFDYV